MINIIYVIIALILAFVVFIALRAINIGIKAKNKNYIDKVGTPSKKNNDLTQKLENLSKLYKSGSITEEEYKLAKKKILEF